MNNILIFIRAYTASAGDLRQSKGADIPHIYPDIIRIADAVSRDDTLSINPEICNENIRFSDRII